ncbi:MAG: hypothetical protein U5L45_08620 [Saprospiraceae bacterium]|nr:hypothetical protein [Saprospiraceae bacterium]
MRERSARKTSVFNQKTIFLGYAHSSFNNSLQRRILIKVLPAYLRRSRQTAN